LALSIPTVLVWNEYIFDIILWFGFDSAVASMGKSYTQIAAWAMIVDGISEAFSEFLDVTGYPMFAMGLGIISASVETMAVATVFLLYDDVTLVTVAYIELGMIVIFFLLIVIIPLYMGWIEEYIPGLFWNLSIWKNRAALGNLMNIALPLSIGSVLAYGEWEVLTIFAAHLGPEEVVAWSILGYIWETFEASTEGIGGSAEVRVGYHLGRGNPGMAKLAAYKSLFVGTCLGIFVTAILFLIGTHLPELFTTDLTIQKGIGEVIPYVGLGNVSMTYGMICWSIVGAQGRYRLATGFAFLTSWGIMIPVAAIMTFLCNYNLKGLVSSVIFGYSALSTCLSLILLQSDWEEASRKIMDIHAFTGQVDSSDSESGEVDSKSSSSSSSSSSSKNSSTHSRLIV